MAERAPGASRRLAGTLPVRDALERLLRWRSAEASVVVQGRARGALGRDTARLAIRHGMEHLTAADLALEAPPRASARAALPSSATLRGRLPEEQARILRMAGRIAAERGERAYLVGGRVRDLLLDRESRDLDLAVEGDAGRIAMELGERLDGRARFHREFGTSLIRVPGGIRIDVAATRVERYPRPGALPRVRRSTLERDLARRDFTINAIAMALGRRGPGRLVDPFGGAADVAARRVRVLHGMSFLEDPTRAFRAVQLAGRLGFRITPATRRLIAVALREGVFERLSAPRLRREVEHLLDGPPPARTVRLLEACGLLAAIHPELTAGPATLAALRRADRLVGRRRRRKPDEPLEGWVVALALIAAALPAASRRELLDRLRPDRRGRESLGLAFEHAARLAARLRRTRSLRPSTLRAACTDLPVEVLLAAAAGSSSARVVRRIERYLDRLREIRADLTGSELLRAGVPRGPAIGRALRAALEAKLDRGASHPAQLKAALRAARSA